MSEDTSRRQTSVYNRILLGLILGAVGGVTANQLSLSGVLPGGGPHTPAPALVWLVDNVADPLGRVFLNMLFMVVVPIVFTSLTLGVANLGNMGKLGRLGLKTFLYFFVTTALAVSLGLALVNIFQPGRGFDPETQEQLLSEFREETEATREIAAEGHFWPDIVVGIVSRNPLREAVELRMLPIIFFSVLFGIALTVLPREKADATLKMLEGVGDAMVVIVGFAMRLAPIAVPALIFKVTALFGWEILRQLSFFTVLVVVGYLLHLFGFYTVMIRVFARYPARAFFKKVMPVMITAFSTSSSSATLPTTIKFTKEELGVPADIAGFVLPLGATMNMNGTALFEGVVILFLAQVFGVELSLGAQLLVVLLAVLTAVGAAGVPSGAIPLMMVVLETVGVPGESIAIIFGVERLLDMGRTVLNVTGDVTAACFVSHSEGYPLKVDESSTL